MSASCVVIAGKFDKLTTNDDGQVNNGQDIFRQTANKSR